MEMLACKTSQELIDQAESWCQKKMATGVRSVFVPAGNTPTGLYRKWEAIRPSYLSGLRLLQIDDVLSGPKSGIFEKYFHDELPSYRSQLVPITKADETADLAILGFGVNGHVAFHEPGLPLDFHSGCVRLTDETRKTLGLKNETWGLTYGLGAFLRARSVLLMVSGISKRETFKRFLSETATFPATGLKSHRDLTVLVDFDWK